EQDLRRGHASSAVIGVFLSCASVDQCGVTSTAKAAAEEPMLIVKPLTTLDGSRCLQTSRGREVWSSCEDLVSPRGVRALDQRSHAFPQIWDYRLFEPPMFPRPNDATPTWVRQRKKLRAVFRECSDGVRHRGFLPCTQIMSLGILAHQESQLNVGQMSEEARVPERS